MSKSSNIIIRELDKLKMFFDNAVVHIDELVKNKSLNTEHYYQHFAKYYYLTYCIKIGSNLVDKILDELELIDDINIIQEYIKKDYDKSCNNYYAKCDLLVKTYSDIENQIVIKRDDLLKYIDIHDKYYYRFADYLSSNFN